MEVLNLGEIEGESRRIAAEHAAWIHNAAMSGKRHYAFLSGGETTVRVSNPSGHGGRNTEYLLAMGAALGAINTVHAIACDTDGIDGTEDNAGAIWTADSLQRASLLGLDINQLLDNNNAYEFFRAMNDLVVTGPTRTNVNDFRLIMID
jgi:glycerate 2-kinase